MKSIIVIGGGAAGMIAAISAKTTNPSCKVILLEKNENHNTYSFFLPENLDGRGIRIVFSPTTNPSSPSRLLLHERETARGSLGDKEGCGGVREQQFEYRPLPPLRHPAART